MTDVVTAFNKRKKKKDKLTKVEREKLEKDVTKHIRDIFNRQDYRKHYEENKAFIELLAFAVPFLRSESVRDMLRDIRNTIHDLYRVFPERMFLVFSRLFDTAGQGQQRLEEEGPGIGAGDASILLSGKSEAELESVLNRIESFVEGMISKKN